MQRTRFALFGLAVTFSSCGNVQPTNSKPGDSNEVNTSENDDLNIVGGSNAAVQLFFASLRSDNVPGGQSCGGTFIADRVVVTAAHCLEGMLVKNLHVAVGETRNIANQTTTRRAKVSRVIIHPDYDPVSLKNDIALLFVDQKERDKLKTVTVMPLNSDSGLPERLGSTLKTTGIAGPHISAFGFGNTTSYGFLPALDLQQAKLKSIPAATCRTAVGLGDLSNSQLCAGFFQAGGVDTCQGDSGGPLILTRGATKSLVGITSFGQGCALPKNPGVYTRVSSFKPWIEQKINEQERVDINSPRDPNRYGEVKDVVAQRCFAEDNRTNSEVFNDENSVALISIAPRYNQATVLLDSDPSTQPFPVVSCESQFEIASNIANPATKIANPTTKIDLRVGLAEQASDGTYSSRVRLAGQVFKLEKMPADVMLGVACKENQSTARSIKFIAEGRYGLLVLGENYYSGTVTAGANSVRSTGDLISSCTVPVNTSFGPTTATLEVRTMQNTAPQTAGASIYASVVMKDVLGRAHRFGLAVGGSDESEMGGFTPPSPFVETSATLRPNGQTYLLKLKNSGNAPVINWELQCNAAFSARLRAQVGTLSGVFPSALVSDEILQLTGATGRAGWHRLRYSPVVTTSNIPGRNGRIEAGRTVEMLITTVHSSQVSSLACSLNNEEATVLSNPLPVLSQDLIAQRFFSKKAHRYSSGSSKLKAILGLKD